MLDAKSLQVRHSWDPIAAGFLLPVQTHLREKSPEEESIVVWFASYVLQSELSFLDNLVDKRLTFEKAIFVKGLFDS